MILRDINHFNNKEHLRQVPRTYGKLLLEAYTQHSGRDYRSNRPHPSI